MDNSFFAYLETIELLLFFLGYPLLYLLVSVAGDLKSVQKWLPFRFVSLMPAAYALVGFLFIGFVLNNLYPDFSFQHIRENTYRPFLKFWGILPVLFIIPQFFKKPVWSLIHSLVFFLIAVKEIWIQVFINNDPSALKNIMNIYTYSLLINFGAFCFILLAVLIYRKIMVKKHH